MATPIPPVELLVCTTLVGWPNQMQVCTSGKKQDRSWARYYYTLSAPCNNQKVNVQQCHYLDGLHMRWDTNYICSIFIEEYRGIEARMTTIQMMGSLVGYNGFSVNNMEFKSWLYLKILINSESLVLWLNQEAPPPLLTTWGFQYWLWAPMHSHWDQSFWLFWWYIMIEIRCITAHHASCVPYFQ